MKIQLKITTAEQTDRYTNRKIHQSRFLFIQEHIKIRSFLFNMEFLGNFWFGEIKEFGEVPKNQGCCKEKLFPRILRRPKHTKITLTISDYFEPVSHDTGIVVIFSSSPVHIFKQEWIPDEN